MYRHSRLLANLPGMQRFGKIVVTAAALLAVAACGQKDSAQPATQQPGTQQPAGPAVPSGPTAPSTPKPKGRECTADDVKTTGKFGEAPTITIPDDCDPPKKLITKDLSDGTGP